MGNSIEFWDCSNNKKWHLYLLVDKKIKKFELISLYPYKVLWDFDKKKEYNNIIKEWHTTFKMSNLKGRNFINLLNNNLSIIKLSYTKGGLWIKQLSFSNSLCAQATRAIINHTLIEEYQLRFFLREEFSYPCGSYLIESRYHILCDCR